jgi:hypothetical protein
LKKGRHISLTNFKGSYARGGVLPEGGAEIDIASAPIPAGSLVDYVHHELTGATIESLQDSGSVVEVAYTDEFGPGLSYGNIAIYRTHGQMLYKMYLSYHANDPSANFLHSMFRQIVGSVQFMQ